MSSVCFPVRVGAKCFLRAQSDRAVRQADCDIACPDSEEITDTDKILGPRCTLTGQLSQRQRVVTVMEPKFTEGCSRKPKLKIRLET